MKFTGFFEATVPNDLPVMVTTISYVEADVIIEALRHRLASVAPGSHVRIDLIAWDGPE